MNHGFFGPRGPFKLLSKRSTPFQPGVRRRAGDLCRTTQTGIRKSTFTRNFRRAGENSHSSHSGSSKPVPGMSLLETVCVLSFAAKAPCSDRLRRGKPRRSVRPTRSLFVRNLGEGALFGSVLFCCPSHKYRRNGRSFTPIVTSVMKTTVPGSVLIHPGNDNYHRGPCEPSTATTIILLLLIIITTIRVKVFVCWLADACLFI